MLHNKFRLLNVIFVVFIIILTTRFFNYSNWNPTWAGWCSYFVYGYLAVLVYNNRAYVRRIKSPLSKWVKLYIGLHLPCLITLLIVHGQSPMTEKGMIFSLMLFLFFYYYYLHNTSESAIIRIFTSVGLFIFAIQAVQQFFPGMAAFGVFNPKLDDSTEIIAEVRNGLYRYRLSGIFFALFCLYYYWAQLLNKTTAKSTLLFLVFLASMYLFLTRQIIFATLVTLALSSFFATNKKRRFIMLVTTIMFIVALFAYSEVLFGELISKTHEQMSEDDIRMIAFSVYWERIISNPLTFLFGNGHPAEFNYLQEELRLFTSDIGFVGQMYHYGVLWVLFYLYTLYVMLIRYRKTIPLYVKLFLFGTAINSIMVFPCSSPNEYFIWASIMYICSLHISKNGMHTAER